MPSRYSAALLALLATSVSSFTTPTTNGRACTNLYETTKEPPFIPMPKDISYGEESRKYRRTVYTHDDWVKHRAPDRFVRNTVSTVTSGIYKNIANEVYFVTTVATAIVVLNAMTGSWQDFSGVVHDGFLKGIFPTLTLPMTPAYWHGGNNAQLMVILMMSAG